MIDYVTGPQPGRQRLQGRRHRRAATKWRRSIASSSAKKQAAEFEAALVYLSAWEEDKYVIAQANVELDEKGRIITELVNARQAGNFVLKQPRRSRLHRRQPEAARLGGRQPDSVPRERRRQPRADGFEHAAPGRAAASRAKRRSSAPAWKRVTARDSGAVVLCKRAGIVDSVDSERIIVRVEGEHHPKAALARSGRDIYQLTKFKRSNQNTCINQKPIVREGRARDEGRRCWPTVLAPIAANWRWDATCWWPSCPGAATTSKTPSWSAKSWSRKTTTPRFTSRSSKSKRATPSWVRKKSRATFRTSARSFLRNLDESGVIRIGATVKPGDILVGKVTPKGETQLTPEEKLLRAIFGEKAGDVRDASLYCPPGIEGTVVDVQDLLPQGRRKRTSAPRPIEAHADREAGEEPRGRNPHSDRRAPKRLDDSARRQGSCWPTCTTRRPTSAC